MGGILSCPEKTPISAQKSRTNFRSRIPTRSQTLMDVAGGKAMAPACASMESVKNPSSTLPFGIRTYSHLCFKKMFGGIRLKNMSKK
jgi:hypothetical protein